MGTTTPRGDLRRLGVRARKQLGQHFLRSEPVLDRIMAAAALTPEDLVVEVGPGLGALTGRLVASEAQIVALEKDETLAEHLSVTFKARKNLHLVRTDALEYDFGQLPETEGKRKVVANLPYNVATPIMFKLAEVKPAFDDMVVMIQKEVADRILSEPGVKKYGALTVMLRYACAGARVVDVPPEAFHPPPKVDSTVIRLTPRQTPPCDAGDAKMLRRVVNAAFQSRRKTLRNALCRGGWSAEQVDAALSVAGISGKIRGERLSLEEFAALSRAFLGM